jgi:hypothetical protein
MANSYALACASGVEWVLLEYSSMSNARECQPDRWQYTWIGFNSVHATKGAANHVVFGIISSC